MTAYLPRAIAALLALAVVDVMWLTTLAHAAV